VVKQIATNSQTRVPMTDPAAGQAPATPFGVL
jgi:hypothetical protein